MQGFSRVSIDSSLFALIYQGVRAGMFVRDAKALCPHLVIFPYDFKSYEEVSGWLSPGCHLSISLLMEDENHILLLVSSIYKG